MTVFALLCSLIIVGRGNAEFNLVQWPQPSNSPIGKFTKGAVATDHGFCSQIGTKVMIQGGNAVDAAIASVFCIGLMHPQSSGIGGGHFMTIYHGKSGSCSVIDARETAPLAATKSMYKDTKTGSKIGWKSIAVPGEIHGLWTAFKKFGSGKIKWNRLLEPTIDLAINGYPVSRQTAMALEKAKKHILNNPTFDDDLSQYSSKIRKEVIETTIMNDFGICGPPPPSSAAIVQSIVKIIDSKMVNNFYNFGLTKSNFSTMQGNAMIYHKFIEAMKFAYARSSVLGDISYDQRALQIARNITSERYIKWVQEKITENAHKVDYYGGEFGMNEEHGTTHLNAVDDAGNAVSITSTINLHFGSFRRSPKTGIIWKDQMDDFSSPLQINAFGIHPSPANYIKPGKRPMSSMSPIIIFNKKTREFKLAVGSSGGSQIISTIAYIAMRALWFNETIKDTVDAPRLHNQLKPYHTSYEPGFPEIYVEQLKFRGQIMKQAVRTNLTVPSVATAIMGDDGKIYANSDWRKGVVSYPGGYSFDVTYNNMGTLQFNYMNILCIIIVLYSQGTFAI